MKKPEFLKLFQTATQAAISAEEENSPAVSKCIDAIARLKKAPESLARDVLCSKTIGKYFLLFKYHVNHKIRSESTILWDLWLFYLYANGGNHNRPTKMIGGDQKKVKPTGIVQQQVKPVTMTGGDQKPMKPVKTTGGDQKPRKYVSTVKMTGIVQKQAKPIGGDQKKVKHVSTVKMTGIVQKPVKMTGGDQKPVNTTGDSTRDKVREILKSSLDKVGEEVVGAEMKKLVASCDPWTVAISVESAMFAKLGGFQGAQKLKYRSILFNMGDSHNPDLRKKVLTGEIKGEKLMTMKTEEMASDKIKMEVEGIKEAKRVRENNSDMIMA